MILQDLSPRDQVSIFALGKQIGERYGVSNIDELAEKLSISLSTENRNRKELVDRILVKPQKPRKNADEEQFETNAARLVQRLMDETGARQTNNVSPTYAPWFCRLTKDLHTDGIPNTHLERLTGVCRPTLARKREDLYLPPTRDLTEQERRVEKTWLAAPPRARKTLDDFYSYYVKQTGDHGLSRKAMRELLLLFGFRKPRGPAPGNHGVDEKTRWEPHALWAGDGKFVRIRINGKLHQFLWYALVCESTTLLVGSLLSDSESASEVIAALRQGEKNQGRLCIGIVIDNRTTRTDDSALKRYCEERNIEIVRTFPGNAKSNGIIEGNFGIFEQHVGQIDITGANDRELARSFAEQLIEVFTQLRNNNPRRNKGSRSTSVDPLDPAGKRTRKAIQVLARRLEREQTDHERKWALIAAARSHFKPLSEEVTLRLKKSIAHASESELLEAQAAFLAQIAKHRERSYDHRYFLGIIRRKQDRAAKEAYAEAIRAGIKVAVELPEASPSNEQTATNIADVLAELGKILTPLKRILYLQNLVYLLFQLFAENRLHQVWPLVLDQLTKNPLVTHAWQQEIVSYLLERLGPALFHDQATIAPTSIPQTTGHGPPAHYQPVH
jgi:transposase InsO family protein